jgi:hypothetical protein
MEKQSTQRKTYQCHFVHSELQGKNYIIYLLYIFL